VINDPTAIEDFSEPEIAQFQPSLPKTEPRTKHEGDGLTRCRVYGHLNFFCKIC